MSLQEQMLILSRFPLLMPTRQDFTHYEGSIQVGSETLDLKVSVPEYPSLSRLSICCSWSLSYILGDFKDDLANSTTTCSSLYEYLTCFAHLIESRLGSPEVASLLHSGRRPPARCYHQLAKDLESIGMDNVTYVSNTLNRVELVVKDGAGRYHKMTLEQKADDTYHVTAELPLKAAIKPAPGMSLVSYYRSLESRVDELQLLWQALDDIDENCWVVEPEAPNRTHIHRRIIIATNVSAHVTLEPTDFAYKPDIKVQGSPGAIARFTAALGEYGMKDWSFACSVVSNLLDALGLDCFPGKPETQPDAHMQLVQLGECAICFVYKTDSGKIPDTACDNVKCCIAFHQECLYQWLDALKKPTVYRHIHGECPKCQSKISCETPSVRKWRDYNTM